MCSMLIEIEHIRIPCSNSNAQHTAKCDTLLTFANSSDIHENTF